MATIAVSNDVSADVVQAFQDAVSQALEELEAARDAVGDKITATARGGGIRVTVSVEDARDRPPGTGIVNSPEW